MKYGDRTIIVIYLFSVVGLPHFEAKKSFKRRHHNVDNNINSTNWRCSGSQTINMLKLCDGVRHCRDGSDETVDACIGQYCPQYAFRCAYGACIQGSLRCNGVADCVDNSDEDSFLCDERDYEKIQIQWQGNCKKSEEMQCVKSHECIATEAMCNGVRDCTDGSDETVELCSYIYCPPYAFRCGYGACVPGVSLCNRVHDCVDGSDESAALCKLNTDEHSNEIAGINNNTAVQSPQERNHEKPDQGDGCNLPYGRTHLIAVDKLTSSIIKHGTRVPNDTFVNFYCNYRWRLIGDNSTRCIGGIWSSEVPRCIKNCSGFAITRGISTEARCNHNGASLNCSLDHLPIGTEAKISCAQGYKFDMNNAETSSSTLICNQDAEWDYSKLKCNAICGLVRSVAQRPGNTKPWEVSIFRRSIVPIFEYVCRAVIISPKFVISAATCTSRTPDGQNSARNLDAVYYNVLEDDPSPHRYQLENVEAAFLSRVHNVSEIVLPNGTVEADWNDQVVVFILVNHFRFSSQLGPICLHAPPPTIVKVATVTTLGAAVCHLSPLVGTAITFDIQNDSLEKVHYLSGIISESHVAGNCKLLHMDFFNPFLLQQLQRYDYIL